MIAVDRSGRSGDRCRCGRGQVIVLHRSGGLLRMRRHGQGERRPRTQLNVFALQYYASFRAGFARERAAGGVKWSAALFTQTCWMRSSVHGVNRLTL